MICSCWTLCGSFNVEKYMKFYVCNIDDDDEDDSVCVAHPMNQRFSQTFIYEAICVCLCLYARSPYSGRQRYLSSFCCHLSRQKHETQICICLLLSQYTFYVRSLLRALTEWLADCLVAYWLQRSKQKALTLDSNEKRPPLCIADKVVVRIEFAVFFFK